MDQATREAYIQAALRYNQVLNRKVDASLFDTFSDKGLHDTTYMLYRHLKLTIVYQMVTRFNKYELNRKRHIPNKTSDREFYRFMKALGLNDRALMRMKINDLIRIKDIYFQDGK